MTLVETILLFPSLAAALSKDAPERSDLVPWLRSQETGSGGAGRKAAARIVVSWYEGGPVDLRLAWAALDEKHREAVRTMLLPEREVIEVEGHAVEETDVAGLLTVG